MERLQGFNTMRESLAATLDERKEPITEETFKQVCMPVGKALKTWGEEKGYQVKQIAAKNRNPQHALSTVDKKVFEKFLQDSELKHLEQKATIGQKNGHLLYVRIPSVAACLYCHGAKDKRPAFILEKYPQDLAFDFKPGDLRGLYRVFIPEKS
ncbi:MAG: Tll0287-like domain-containing protein [Oligoflexus sp.]